MFAIIQASGHQIRVEPGQHIDLDRLSSETGQEVTFDQVLFVSRDDGSLVAGSPVVPGARVASSRWIGDGLRIDEESLWTATHAAP